MLLSNGLTSYEIDVALTALAASSTDLGIIALAPRATHANLILIHQVDFIVAQETASGLATCIPAAIRLGVSRLVRSTYIAGLSGVLRDAIADSLVEEKRFCSVAGIARNVNCHPNTLRKHWRQGRIKGVPRLEDFVWLVAIEYARRLLCAGYSVRDTTELIGCTAVTLRRRVGDLLGLCPSDLVDNEAAARLQHLLWPSHPFRPC